MEFREYYRKNVVLWWGVLLVTVACNQGSGIDPQMNEPSRQGERDAMVEGQIISRGVKDPLVIQAMRDVPRHKFVIEPEQEYSYEDRPLPIGYGQTISQPYIVAYMTEALKLQTTDKVLEIGTGSGYQAAVLGKIVSQVYTIEIVEPLAKRAEEILNQLGYQNVHVQAGDGYQGWPTESPFDAIILTAAPDHIPQPLLDQLAIGGRLILPVGKFLQELVLVKRTTEGYQQQVLLPVAFVPMTGEAEKE
jgi:protein-L-isoaspartate(D-aspartate) O-methyltransferase